MKRFWAILLTTILSLSLLSSISFAEEQALAEGESAAIAEVEYPDFDFSFSTYSSTQDYTVYEVRMTMQAGYQEFQNYPGGGVKTIHSGIGFMDPFGEGYYYAGILYPEAETAPEATYVSDWMHANLSPDLFCIYHTAAGDIYAWDGIYGANAKDRSNYMNGETPRYTVDYVNGTMPTRGDALINVISGGIRE